MQGVDWDWAWGEMKSGDRPGIAAGSSASSACPKCGTEMVITRITPILFRGTFEELSLMCKTCGYTKKIRIERS